MKSKLIAFTNSYAAGLKKHLKTPNGTSLNSARKLGLRALKLGLASLDVARTHEKIWEGLGLPHTSPRERDRLSRRGHAFAKAACAAITEALKATRTVTGRLEKSIAKLTQRTAELASSNTKLKLEIDQRRSAEKSLKSSEQSSALMLKDSLRMQDELRHLSRRLLFVQEEERKRISRELHDVVAQNLTGINLQLCALKALKTASTHELHEKIVTTQSVVLQSVENVHRFARDLRPSLLDDLGLIPALKSHIKAVWQETKLPIELTSFAGVERMDSPAKTVFYRVAQESLSNIVQHAEARRVTIRLASGNGQASMVVRDNGCGFVVQDLHTSESGGHLGLVGMRERVEMIGGKFDVESQPGKHTTIRVTIPIRNEDAKSSVDTENNSNSLL
ncbi:MAG: sensor histidine kinase [Terrimicrobiaceae bacterium]